MGDGTSLSALATMRQSEAVWTGTLHRRRRLREGEPYGQTAEVSDAMAAVDASANDPYWTLAVSFVQRKTKTRHSNAIPLSISWMVIPACSDCAAFFLLETVQRNHPHRMPLIMTFREPTVTTPN